MIFNQDVRKVSILAFLFLIGFWGQASASFNGETLICNTTTFSKTKVGSFAESPLGSDTIYAFRIGTEELAGQNLKGIETNQALRAFAFREFVRAFKQFSPPPSDRAALVAEGAQTISRKCQGHGFFLVWVPRSKLRWEMESKNNATMNTFDEAKRLIDDKLKSDPPPNLLSPAPLKGQIETENRKTPATLIDTF